MGSHRWITGVVLAAVMAGCGSAGGPSVSGELPSPAQASAATSSPASVAPSPEPSPSPTFALPSPLIAIPSTEPVADWESYSSRRFDYAFRHPSAWIEEPGDKMDTFLVASSGGGVDLFLGGSRMVVKVVPLPSGTTLFEVAKAVAKARQEDLGGKARITSTKVAGRDARFVTVSGTYEFVPATSYDAVFIRGKSVYVVLFLSEGDPDGELALFMQVLTTFKLT